MKVVESMHSLVIEACSVFHAVDTTLHERTMIPLLSWSLPSRGTTDSQTITKRCQISIAM